MQLAAYSPLIPDNLNSRTRHTCCQPASSCLPLLTAPRLNHRHPPQPINSCHAHAQAPTPRRPNELGRRLPRLRSRNSADACVSSLVGSSRRLCACTCVCFAARPGGHAKREFAPSCCYAYPIHWEPGRLRHINEFSLYRPATSISVEPLPCIYTTSYSGF